jgi:hypothetical protein
VEVEVTVLVGVMVGVSVGMGVEVGVNVRVGVGVLVANMEVKGWLGLTSQTINRIMPAKISRPAAPYTNRVLLLWRRFR